MEISHTAQDIHKLFLVSTITLGQDAYNVHETWLNLLIDVPEMRDRHLLDNLDDLWRDGMVTASGERLDALFRLAILQAKFVEVLFEMQMIPTHVRNVIMMRNGYVQSRIMERKMEAIRVPTRRGKKIVKADTTPSKMPKWVH